MEALLAMVLAWVVLSVSHARQLKSTAVYGFAIGLTLSGIAFFGGLYNPAVATASAMGALLQTGMMGFEGPAIYILGPIVGGILAALMHCCCSGEGFGFSSKRV